MVTIEEAGKDFGWVEEEFEDFKETYVKTGYPEPNKKFRVINESFQLSMEESYFWILSALQHDMAFPTVEKITDIFSSAENSSIFGQASQRLGIQQDRISQTLATTGKMVKDLFQLVRELRIIDERLAAYDAWNKNKSKSADATLKQLYIDYVESQGGQTKPSSVYGLSQQLGYTTLPDYFFNTRIYPKYKGKDKNGNDWYEVDKNEIDKVVDALPTNNNLKNVLRRKLLEFSIWKEHIEKETRARRTFQIHYLRQQWAVIKMYMGWLKPYLRNVKRLSMDEKQVLGPEIISAFETAALEIEIIAYDKKKAQKGYSPCVLINFKYFVKPSLSYQQPESYQRGPIHVGRVDITMRSYGWSEAEINAYKKYKDQEEMELLSVIDGSLKAAIDLLSVDLERYLAEAGEEEFKKKLEEKKKEDKKDDRTFLQKFFNKQKGEDEGKGFTGGVLEPFVSVFMGFGEIAGAFVPASFVQKKDDTKVDPEKKLAAAKSASKKMNPVWANYKKSHGLLTW